MRGLPSAPALLSRGSVDIDSGEFTPLMVAAAEGYSRIATILVDNGADVSIVGQNGATALHGSAQSGHLGVTKVLVKAGDDLEAATYSVGSTPLHMAASKGHSEVMRVLIKAGADPNRRRLDGATPLFRAVTAGHDGAVRVLLRVNEDPLLMATDTAGQSHVPLESGAHNGHSEVVRELVQQLGI